MTTFFPQGIVGTVYSAVEPILRRQAGYDSWRTGSLDQKGWNRLIDDAAQELKAVGLPPADIPLMKRLPSDPQAMAGEIVRSLIDRGILPSGDGNDAENAAQRGAGYYHADLQTFIYPEEGLLLAAVCAALKPRRALFLGSYYGYWASFAAPHILGQGGAMTLVDPDRRVCAVAAQNFEAMGYDAEIVEATGEAFLADAADAFDLVVIDAEMPRDHPDPDVRGKGIYHRLLATSLPRMTTDSTLICHNILFTDHTGAPAIDATIKRNRHELGPFMRLARQHFDFVECATTEGIGIGRRLPLVEG